MAVQGHSDELIALRPDPQQPARLPPWRVFLWSKPMQDQKPSDDVSARFLSYQQLKAVKGIPFSRIHVDRLEKAGRFPKRVRLAESTVAWVESEIDAWSAARVRERDAP
jgi:prophage regulatory protein